MKRTRQAVGKGVAKPLALLDESRRRVYLGERLRTTQPPLPPETWAVEVNKMVKVMSQRLQAACKLRRN